MFILAVISAALLSYYLAHHGAIVVGLGVGFFVTGLIMQFRTPGAGALNGIVTKTDILRAVKQ